MKYLIAVKDALVSFFCWLWQMLSMVFMFLFEFLIDMLESTSDTIGDFLDDIGDMFDE